MRLSFRILILYALLGGFAYWPCLRAPFLNWDDETYVTQNAWVRELSWDHLKLISTKPLVQTYGPVHLLSYSLDHAIWGLRPAGFRLTNIALHVANAYLLFLVLVTLGLPFRAACIAGAVWCVHPVQVENVAWISQRKTLLAEFFSLSAILLYRQGEGEERRRFAYAASLGAFLLALLSKATAVYVVPLLALIRWRDGRPFTRRWLLGWSGFFLPALLVGWIAIQTHRAPQDLGTSRAIVGVAPTVSTMLPVLSLRYPSTLLWPTNLSLLYAPPVHEDPWNRHTLAAVLVIAMAGGLALLSRERRREAMMWLGWYVLALAPVLNILPNSVIMQDRYLYSASGAFIAWLMTVFRPGNAGFAMARTAFMGFAAIIVACLLFLTIQRTSVWASPERLWRDTISNAPELQTPYVKLAEILAEAGREGEAEAFYRRAMETPPKKAWEFYGTSGEVLARLGLAKMYERQDRLGDAATLLEEALRYNASNQLMAVVHVHRAYIALRQKDRKKAIRHYQRAAELDPENPDAQRALAMLRWGDPLLGPASQDGPSRGERTGIPDGEAADRHRLR